MTMSIAPLPDDAGDGAEIFEDLSDDDPTGFQARAVSVGNEFKHVAREWLGKAGATFVRDHHMVGSYHVEGLICGTNQRQFLVLAHGVLDDDNQAGLKRSDTVKKAGFDAIQIRRLRQLPILLLTSHLPAASSTVSSLLSDCAQDIFDVMAIHGNLTDFHRLRHYLHDDPFPGQLPAAWRDNPSTWTPELFDGDDAPIPFQVTYGATTEDPEDGVEKAY
ncbi:MAG: hypothetical protein GY925_00395 [Actinomycetia bacterium]|nr:hypothetical protein [Actinomycetes bacterium]